MRIGHGYDVHRLVTGRKLILGGVDIPHAFGLLGHSDADVVTHALMDALLGAAALGDIGRHFPDTDPAYAGANSLGLLGHVMALLAQEGWRVENADVTILAQKPKLKDGHQRQSHHGRGPGLYRHRAGHRRPRRGPAGDPGGLSRHETQKRNLCSSRAYTGAGGAFL